MKALNTCNHLSDFSFHQRTSSLAERMSIFQNSKFVQRVPFLTCILEAPVGDSTVTHNILISFFLDPHLHIDFPHHFKVEPTFQRTWTLKCLISYTKSILHRN